MNGKAHAVISGGAVAAILLVARESDPQARLPHPVFGGIVAALTASVPDLLEPATSPNHRQFFHSVAFASAVVSLLREIYDWAPDTPAAQLLRDVLLSAGLSYVVHLGIDSTTAKCIPWFGKCS